MILASPDDPESRARGYADAESRGSGHRPQELAGWALAAVDALDDDVDRPCYFSMTGGQGTVGLWGRHAASELGVHRLDVEAALGDPHAMPDDLAVDAIGYTCGYFLPAMTRATGTDPGLMDVVAVRDGVVVGKAVAMAHDAAGGVGPAAAATLEGAPIDVLLALWGRPHGPVEVRGSRVVFDRWHALPGTAFQFGTWD
jgi:hypothetical protein